MCLHPASVRSGITAFRFRRLPAPFLLIETLLISTAPSKRAKLTEFFFADAEQRARHTWTGADFGRAGSLNFQCTSFCDTTLESPTKGHWVGWGGTYDDIVRGRRRPVSCPFHGQQGPVGLRQPGVERLQDDTFVATIYGHWVEGEQPFILSVRLKLAELDARLR